MDQSKESLVIEIAEQLCVAEILKESNLKARNSLALLNIDSAVEDILKFYGLHNGFIQEDEADSRDVIYSMLRRIKDQNKIVGAEQEAIVKVHELRHGLYKEEHPKVDTKTVSEYLSLAKILLAHLFDYRATKEEWDKMADTIRKSISK